MKEFFDSLISQWWGIFIIVLVCLLLWLILSISLYRLFFKRFYDILLSLLGIVILSPVFLVLMVLGMIKMGGNPFFSQKRPGKKEKIFSLVKFRTMTNKRDAQGNLLPDAERLTRYGKFLRKTSLDELPELFNIFVGQMSIIGPRPLLPQYLPLYNMTQRERHRVRPGLTGLAQVSGRNALSWQEKFDKDIEYVGKISFFGDIKIFFLTVIKVFKHEGISQKGNATMEMFCGNDEINILILSAGRRVELVKCFQNAKKELKISSKIVAADMSKTAPALYFADDHELLPALRSETYLDALIKICKKHKIKLIIPTIDTELPLLASNCKLIEERSGARVMISEESFISICRDKFKTAEALKEHGFKVPHTLTPEEVQNAADFPLFIKPFDGSSSINAFTVNNREELDFFHHYIVNPIVQEKIGGQEYTVDIFCDFEARLITIVPRKRLAVRSGEILKGQIDKNPVIVEEIKKFVEVFKPKGHITVQGFLCESAFYFLEINPRFGGGAPMSIKAGADSCRNLYQLLKGEKLTYHESYEDQIVFTRFDDCVRVPND